jgi:hypothetical protein
VIGRRPWYARAMSNGRRARILVTTLVVLASAGCAGAAGQSEDERFRGALGQAPVMVNPSFTGAADPAVSSNWDSTYRMLSFSAAEVCFLAEWNVPAHIAPSLHFKLEAWRSLDEDRRTVPQVMSRSVDVLDGATVARIKANDRPIRDDVPPEIRAMAPPLTPMRVCFAPAVIRPESRYLEPLPRPLGRGRRTPPHRRRLAPGPAGWRPTGRRFAGRRAGRYMMGMHREEHTWNIRIEASAAFDEDYQGELDGYAWRDQLLRELQGRLATAVLRELAAARGWRVRTGNRGLAATDELLIHVELEPSDDPPGR